MTGEVFCVTLGEHPTPAWGLGDYLTWNHPHKGRKRLYVRCMFIRNRGDDALAQSLAYLPDDTI